MFGQPVDTSWYFDIPTQTEALNRLVYVAEQGEPFVLMTAAHGSGKSTLLNRVKSECSRMGCSVVLLSVAALDEMSFLWQICGGLSIAPRGEQTRSELMAAIRDELSGRAMCNNRTVIILDDLHTSASDLALMIQFLTAINQQTDGAVSVIAATETTLPAELQSLSALNVRLPLLDDDESRDFVYGCLAFGNVPAERITGDGMRALLSFAQGNTGQLRRICQIVQVAATMHHDLQITSDTVDALTADTLGV